ncbi:phage tail protein [Jiangella mangrovi]|uniref:Phage tail-like protein n=1 Tax=Jiangella mangrovi TaxID=1524084 RepID=A0A7W9GXM0_9ACTN|nr:phage tail protein [Jiangella mangrovi]MBB5791626.1 phage tail-like protein [Jiangella mangrovi]
MRKRTPVAGAAVAAAAALVLSTSAPSVAQSVPTSAVYALEIDGVRLTMQQCVGFGVATEVVEHQETGPGGEAVTRKVPGEPRVLDLVCSRAVSDDETLEEWQEASLAGIASARKDISVWLFDQAGEPVAEFLYVNAWPSELTYIDAGDGSGRLLEVVTIVSDHMERAS